MGLSHGGTDGHNFAMCFLIPMYGIGINMGMNNAGVMQEGSIQSEGFGKTLEWVFTHMGKVVGTEIKIDLDTKFIDYLVQFKTTISLSCLPLIYKTEILLPKGPQPRN